MRTPRIDRMRERHFNTTPCITAEHLVLQTQAYKQFAGDARFPREGRQSYS